AGPSFSGGPCGGPCRLDSDLHLFATAKLPLGLRTRPERAAAHAPVSPVSDLWGQRYFSDHVVAPADHHLRNRADRDRVPAGGHQLSGARAGRSHKFRNLLPGPLSRWLRGGVCPLRPPAGTAQLLRIFHLECLTPPGWQLPLPPAPAGGVVTECRRNSCHGDWRPEGSPDACVPRLVVSGGG